MTEATGVRPERRRAPAPSDPRADPTGFQALEIDTRLLGMIVALAVIWIGFHILSGGRFLDGPQPLEPVRPERVDRDHGDRHGPDHRVAQHRPVGRVAAGVPRLHDGDGPGGLDPEDPRARASTSRTPGSSPWRSASSSARSSAASRASSSPTAACRRSSSRSAGFLIWRGLIFRYAQGQTIAPMDSTFQLIGGGPAGVARRLASWIAGGLACVGIALTLLSGRRRRRRYGFPVRPMWAEVAVGVDRLRGRPRRRLRSPTATPGRRPSRPSTPRSTASPSRPAA